MPARTFNLVRTLKKLLLSALVVFSFIAYTIRERSVGLTGTNDPAPTAVYGTKQASLSPQSMSTVTVSGSMYKDGVYVGNVTDAFYGNVQVEAVISGGSITDVQFLDYPQDRRTSRFINSQAVPYLVTEAIQAQSARVDIISGATLTSEAFIQSLQSALNKAKQAL